MKTTMKFTKNEGRIEINCGIGYNAVDAAKATKLVSGSKALNTIRSFFNIYEYVQPNFGFGAATKDELQVLIKFVRHTTGTWTPCSEIKKQGIAAHFVSEFEAAFGKEG